MKEFHFTTEKEQAEIEQILLQRKKKKSKQQLLFLSIFHFYCVYHHSVLCTDGAVYRFQWIRSGA